MTIILAEKLFNRVIFNPPGMSLLVASNLLHEQHDFAIEPNMKCSICPSDRPRFGCSYEVCERPARELE
jgi:hypothetical protein